jgi:hypothetical protein
MRVAKAWVATMSGSGMTIICVAIKRSGTLDQLRGDENITAR